MSRLQPQELVAFGARYALAGPAGASEQTVILRATPGPSVYLRWGTLAVADPWWPEALPDCQVISIGQGEQPTVLSTVAAHREDRAEPVTMACAASIGTLEQVCTLAASRPG